jgi:myosin heavy subunit
MKDFYEGKLHAMERLLEQKEEERQKIILELERLKESNHDTRDLEEQLKKKEEHIAGIRKQKLQLKDLTVVSSKNEAEIKKLHYDVLAMKERKVLMQKQLAEERKMHAQEIKRLKKEVLQKDRETRKWQKISNQKTSEAAKANHMAQLKAQQLGQLREKYKGAEKTIRMLQIKKGVMAKAGLDPVMVGRRGKDTRAARDQGRNPADEGRGVDVDSLRDYFDKKVAEVGRKEALADKLARGWEEHFQLTLQRGELVEREAAESKDDIQALDLRIHYEEDQIRKLARRLGKGAPNDVQQTDQMSSFLYGKDFEKVCNGEC